MTINEDVEEQYKAHCEHNGKLMYRTGNPKQYYCLLRAVSCPYYKSKDNNDLCMNKVYEEK